MLLMKVTPTTIDVMNLAGWLLVDVIELECTVWGRFERSLIVGRN